MAEKKKNPKAEFDAFVQSLRGKSEKELRKIEEDIIKQCDKIDADAAGKEFVLPDTENKAEVFAAIRAFLSKGSYQWSYTLGAIALADAWADPSVKTIKYPVLNTSLTTLGQRSYEGYDEWKKVVMINDYFKPMHDEYAQVANDIYDAASRHSAVIDALALFDKEAANVAADVPVKE